MFYVLQALWKREIIKFVRDRSRVIGALAQPIVFWLLLGLGFQRSFALPGVDTDAVNYLEYLFPGIIALMILFTAIFSTISIVEERKSGFLQAALIAPISRTAFVFGTTLGGTTLVLLQTLLLLFLLPAIGHIPSVSGFLVIALTCFLTGLSFTALGVSIAWIMSTTRGFHAIMNLFLLPLWMLSGAFFPYAGASKVLQWFILLNPVSYAVDALRMGMYMPDEVPDTLQNLPISLLITALFAAFTIGIAVWVIRRPMFKA